MGVASELQRGYKDRWKNVKNVFKIKLKKDELLAYIGYKQITEY